MPPLSGPRAVQVTRSLTQLATLGWQSRVVCFGARSNRYQQDYTMSPEAESGGAVRLIQVPSPEEWFLVRALWRVCPPLKRLPDEKRVWIRRGADGGSTRPDRAAGRPAGQLRAALVGSPDWPAAAPGDAACRGSRTFRIRGWTARTSTAPAWQRRIWSRMERDVIAEATRIVFVNEQTADRVMAKYPAEWRARARVVPQGFDPRVRAACRAPARHRAAAARLHRPFL